ncbi:MAG: S1C family serine protease [bacterium]
MKVKFIFILIIGLFILYNYPSNASNILRSMESEFIKIIGNISPSIVEISATKLMRSPRGDRVSNKNIGTGVIYDENGNIITTESVIAGSKKIEVSLYDGKTYDAKVIGTDAGSGIAVIKINAENLNVPNMGNSDKLRSGSWVITIGRSYGESSTISSGIVSGFEIIPNRPAYYEAIRIDANINPGNSGGAVVDMDGNLIGIILATIAEPRTLDFSRTFPEIIKERIYPLDRLDEKLEVTLLGHGKQNFAIPINYARKIADDLIRYGKIERGWLGIYIEPVEDGRIKKAGIESVKGIIVKQVFDNSPAEKAGIVKGDIIIKFNEQRVTSVLEFTRLIADSKPGSTITLTIIRGNKTQTINIEVGRMPKN